MEAWALFLSEPIGLRSLRFPDAEQRHKASRRDQCPAKSLAGFELAIGDSGPDRTL